MSNKVTLSEKKFRNYKYRVIYPKGRNDDGSPKRSSKWFVKKAEALAFKKKTEDELKDKGSANLPITTAEARAVEVFRELISDIPDGAGTYTLMDAVDSFKKQINLKNKAMTCYQVGDSLLASIESVGGTSTRHYYSRKNEIARFNKAYGDWHACDVSKAVVDDFIENLTTVDRRASDNRKTPFTPKPLSHNSKIAYRVMLIQLLNHALELGAVSENVAKQKMKKTKTKIGILKPKQVAALFDQAPDDLIPALALSFFAGLRRSELLKMDWSDIDIMRKQVLVSEENKTGDRIVTMSDCLTAWLTPYAQHEGLVIASEEIFRNRLETARTAAKLKKWPHNAGRHSYGTYFYAKHESIDRTAKEMGHTDTRVTRNRYVTTTPHEVAELFWSITPAEVENIINIKSA